MPERAEIEAVARALAKLANDTAEQVGMEHDYGWEEYEAEAETAIAALDRVRDARGNDEDPEIRREIEELKAELRSPQAEDHEREALAAEMRKLANRDPNTHMHWLPLSTVEYVLREFPPLDRPSELGQIPSSSRDGTVAVENAGESDEGGN